MKLKQTLSITLLAAACANAQATIVSGYGVEASTTTASNCPSYCTTANGGDFQYDSAGGEFILSAYSSQNSYGFASSSAVYDGSSTYLPTLKVYGSSAEGAGAFANAFGVQGYTYHGADTTITLDFNLHGSVADNLSGYVNNSLSASVAVIFGSTLDWYADFATLVYEVAPGNGDTVAGIGSAYIGSGINQNSPGSITFDLTDGMDFYVVASMGATSKNGFADGMNTFTMQFNDDTGLVAASVVPVPAAVWLFASGLLGLAGVARRKTSV